MSKSKQKYFLELYQPIHLQFKRYCRAAAYYDMPCEDLINETLLVAYKKIDGLKEEKAFLSFLIGISKNILLNARRKKKAETVSNEILLTQHPDSKNNIDQQNNVATLYQALAQLPQLQREAIVLFEITGFSIKEIAAIQNSGISAVKQRLARGRKALKTILINDLTPKNIKL
ncbi:MAG: RNA polymerase sigma factor [Bacteroidota bacterium]